MRKEKSQKNHSILSMWIIVCGLFYIFAYQFNMPFRADVFLYGMLVGLIVMTILSGRVILTKQFVLFILMDIVAFIGILYTSKVSEAWREALLITFFALVFVLSLTNVSLVRSFTKWIYLVSIVVIFSSILHILLPYWFNDVMSQLLREDAYEQLMSSFTIDNTFAGIAAYTPNTTFSAAIVFGNSFLNITKKNKHPIIVNKVLNIVLIVLSLFTIIICSKRGIFVATVIATIVMMFSLYRRRKFMVKFLGVVFIFAFVLVVLYHTSDFVYSFFNRFVSEDFLTGRDEIYKSLISAFIEGDIWLGNGTAATYQIADKGAHNIYLQILYDHGILLSTPYYIFLLYNYYIAFKSKCHISIFVQTLFLVYGLSGNPLYSNMFMIIYLYYVLYAMKKPTQKKQILRDENYREEYNKTSVSS